MNKIDTYFADWIPKSGLFTLKIDAVLLLYLLGRVLMHVLEIIMVNIVGYNNTYYESESSM